MIITEVHIDRQRSSRWATVNYEQPVLVVLAWASAAGEGVDDLELLVSHLVKENLQKH